MQPIHVSDRIGFVIFVTGVIIAWPDEHFARKRFGLI